MISIGKLIQWFLGVFEINTSSNISKLPQNITSRFVVFHCHQIRESYPPLFQQQDKAVPSVAMATVIFYM